MKCLARLNLRHYFSQPGGNMQPTQMVWVQGLALKAIEQYGLIVKDAWVESTDGGAWNISPSERMFNALQQVVAALTPEERERLIGDVQASSPPRWHVRKRDRPETVTTERALLMRAHSALLKAILSYFPRPQ